MITVGHINRNAIIALIVCLLLFNYAALSAARQPLFESFKSIIVIDPGHGGQDFGARGPDGTLEKMVTLELARLISAELEPEYKVVLTRTDDYRVDLDNRTSLANHLEADIFISIHTGGSFVHSTTGTAVYYYRNFSGPDAGHQPPPSGADQTPNEPVLWNNVQSSQLSKSRALAGTIDNRINGIAAIRSRLEGSPLAVLQGAAMPAVLIEAGYLSNPAEERNLSNNRFLIEFAAQISRGIEDFLISIQP